ncbi:MAG TPA: NAD-binding protein, partial [Chondromyces sp.]|nr:NAD-binding protein [Chondromyces sp.]
TLKENPYPEKVVHFIQGPPYKDDTLKRANLRGASIALITADQNANEVRADMNSILTLVAMKGFHPDLYCIVEILTKDQVINAERAGADEVIETNRHASLVMLNSIHFDRVSDTMAHLLNPLNDKHLTAIKLEDHWENKKFKQLSLLLLEKNILLVGVKRKEKTHINPSLDFVIEKGDELIVIMH